MNLNKPIVPMIFTIALVLATGGCSGGSSSSPTASSQDPVAKALNEGTVVTGTAKSDCDNTVVLEAVNTLCELFGAGSCINQQSSCSSYARQVYSGSQLVEEGTSWNGRGGSGEQMADAALCTLRELSPKVQGGGPLISNTPDINLGIGTVKIRQEVGYLDFDRVNARFKGYRKMYIELPVLGKFDAVAQDIEVQKAEFGGHSFNPFPFAGDYQILFGYGLNITTEEKNKLITIKPPAFPVVTPLGTFSAQPTFEYRSFTDVADAYATDHTYVLLPPDSEGEVALRLSDLFGILPGVDNTTTPKPGLSGYKEKRGGWISQLGLGNRGTGVGSESVWAPPASGVFSRPDYDASGKLDFLSYAPRSNEEIRPSVYAKAAVEIKYPEITDPYVLLPGWVKGLPGGLTPTAYILVAPTIEAGAAGQFGIVLSEGTNYYRQKEFDLENSRLAALGIYSGVKANASFGIKTQLVIKVDAVYSTPFGDLAVNLIDIDPEFPIPLAGGTPTASAVHFASAYSTSDSTPVFLETLDSLSTFKAAKPDPKAFITQCYAEEITSEPTPTPTSEKGNPEDLITNEIWPCNVCMATDEVKDAGGTIKEPAHSDFLMPATTLPTTWKCDSKEKSGCMDRCSWDKTFDANGKPNLIVIAGPLDIANGIPATDPQHAFFKACMAPCGVVFGSIAGPPCQKDSTPPQVTTTNTNIASFPTTSSVTVTFNKQMDQATINGNTFLVADVDGIPVEGSIAYDPRSLIAAFTPARSLNFNSTYTVRITVGIQDIDGNPLPAEFTSTFTTEQQTTRQ